MIKILDLCCGEGGASMGYYKACEHHGLAVEITGIDNVSKKYYPFRFLLADAVEYAVENAHLYDFIHASPPCQAHSIATVKQRAAGKKYNDIIIPIRAAMLASGKPGVIENVPFAPIRPDLKLYGNMFGLPIIKQRWFELIGWWMLSPVKPQKKGSVRDGDYISIYGKQGYRKYSRLPPGWRPKFDQGSGIKTWQYAMNMPWVKSDVGIAQAIPPDYTQYIFNEFLNQYQHDSRIQNSIS